MNRTLAQFGRPVGRLFYLLVSLLIVVSLRPAAFALPAKATISDTIYRADGTTARGTLIITWPAFTTADKQVVAAGTLTAPIAADGKVNLQLVPTEGATPGVSYKVVVKSADGTTDVEWWSVPNSTSVPISAIRSRTAPPATIVLNNAQLSAKLDRSGDTPVTMAGLRFASKFPSVQAAVDDAGKTGAVIVPPDYPGADTYTSTKAAVLDFRKGGLAVNDIVTKGPKVDVRAFGATGSRQATTATCTAGSRTVALASAIDFSNGDGIHLYHCGAAVTLATPSAPTATVMGTPGSTSHSYKISALTDAGGQTAASTAATVSNASANMNFSNNVQVSWYAPSTNPPKAYAVYGDSGVFKDIVGIPGNAHYWVSKRPYRLNELVQPNTWNGHFYKVTGAVNTTCLLIDGAGNGVTPGTHTCTPKSMAGISAGIELTVDKEQGSVYGEVITVTSTTATTFTASFSKSHYIGYTILTASGASEPAWCTSAGCTVADGGLTLTEQPYTWTDIGAANWASHPARTVAPTAPASALNDSLVTTVASGAGTTTLTLADAAGASTAGASVTHDDTAALNAAATFAHTKCNTVYPPGSAAVQQCAALYFPFGWYLTSSAINPQSANIFSDGQAVIEQTIPTRNLLDLSSTYEFSAANIGLWGGWNQIYYTNTNTGGSVRLHEVDFTHAWNFAVFTRGTQTSPVNDDHLSLQLNWKGGHVKECRHILYNTGDQSTFDSVAVSFANLNRDGVGHFQNFGGLLIRNLFSSPGYAYPYSHWISNHGFVTVDGNSRFGGEGNGGYALVFNYAHYGFEPSTGVNAGFPGTAIPYNGQSIRVKDSSVCIGSGQPWAAVLNLIDAVPSQFSLKNVGCISNDPIVRNGGGVDLDGYFTDPSNWSQMVPPTLQWEIEGNQIASGVTSTNVPVQLLGYLRRNDLSLSAAPAAGNWSKGQVLFSSNAQNLGNAPLWVNLRAGKAAPKWAGSTAYSAGSYIVPSTDNGHVYIAAVAGTSGSSAPTWPTSAKGVATDGGVTWIEAGPSALFLTTGFTGCDSSNAVLCLTHNTNLAGLKITNGTGYSSLLLDSYAGSTETFNLTSDDSANKRVTLNVKTGYSWLLNGATNALLAHSGGTLKFTNNNSGGGDQLVVDGTTANTKYCYDKAGTVCDKAGSGAPTGACTTGSTYRRTDGAAASTFYVCESGAWAAK